MSAGDWLIIGFGAAMIGVKALLIVAHDRSGGRNARIEGEETWPDETRPHGGF
ncbi:MAG: hypothetical protein ACM3W4_04880 [Ignavibacteriales bacterium]